MQPLRRHLLEIVFQPERALSPSIRLSRKKSPLGRGFCNKIYGGYRKGGENVLPENIPEREWHCHAAQHEVGDGEAHDEVVPRRPHYRLAQDGVLRGAGMRASQSNLGSLWGKVRRFLFCPPQN